MNSPIRAIMPGIITFLGGAAVTGLLVFLVSSKPGRRVPPPILEELAEATDPNLAQDTKVEPRLNGPVFGNEERAALKSDTTQASKAASSEQLVTNQNQSPQVVYDLRGASGGRSGAVTNESTTTRATNTAKASSENYTRHSNTQPKLYKVPVAKPKPSPFVSIRAAKELYRAGRLTKTEYKIMVERLELDLDSKIETLKADYRAGRLTKTEYKIAVERAKMQYKG